MDVSRPPHARESVLDAFERLLGAGSERAATLDAIAHEAGVSKGGLLYHFPAKDALESALIERLEVRVQEDAAGLAAAPDGPVAAFMRASILHEGPLDHTIAAVARLAQSGSASAADALRRVRDVWADMLRPHARDETALQLVMLVSDGLYFNNALGVGSVPGPVPRGTELDALIALVESATRD